MLAGVVADMSDERSMGRVPLAQPFGRQVRSPGGTRGTVLSAVLHVAFLALILWISRRHYLEAEKSPGELGRRGGGGGGGGIRGLAVFTPARPAQAPAPPPVQPPLVVPQHIEPLPETPPAAVTPAVTAPPPQAGAGDGTGRGSGAGPGTGTGAGTGTGGGTGSGTGNDSGPGGGGGRVYPPQPQGIILPPPGAPRDLRGTRLTVTFRISEKGEVMDVSTDPAIRDRGYRNEFLDRMRRYTFTPAYLEGHAVPAQYPITITL